MAKEKKPLSEEEKELRQKMTIGGEPAFDIEGELTEEAQEQLLAAISKAINSDGTRAAIDKIYKSISKTSDPVKQIVEAYTKLLQRTISPELLESIKAITTDLQEVSDLLQELTELEPYINAELEKPEYNGETLDSITGKYTARELLELLEDPQQPFTKAVIAARAARDSVEHTTIKRPESIEFPLDKINSHAWNLLKEDTAGQVTIDFNMLPDDKKDLQATAYYSINFESLGDDIAITRRLQPFDKRVYTAVSALFNAGNAIVTATQIHAQMGYTNKPSKNQIKKIDESLSKMTGAQILLDTEMEARVLNYKRFEYEGSLLPIERVRAIINGQLTESAVHIFREPPLMTFAKERRQVTTVNVSLLQSPVSKTDANLQIEDYLIERISRAKNGKSKSCKILFKTLFKHANVNTASQKSRAPEKIKAYLTHYQQENYIKRFSFAKDSVTVFF